MLNANALPGSKGIGNNAVATATFAGDQVFRRDSGSDLQLIEEKDDGKSWLVRYVGDAKEDIVSRRLLKRLRPALWQHLETVRHFESLSDEEKTEYEKQHTIDGEGPSKCSCCNDDD